MKIDKAIKNLKAGRKDAGMIPVDEYTATLDLSIEALKAVAFWNHKQLSQFQIHLPGETEE